MVGVKYEHIFYLLKANPPPSEIIGYLSNNLKIRLHKEYDSSDAVIISARLLLDNKLISDDQICI